jgi:hypothetical protein
MDSLKMLALVLVIIVALVAFAFSELAKMPSSCALVGLEAQEQMGPGKVLLIHRSYGCGCVLAQECRFTGNLLACERTVLMAIGSQ